MSATRARRQLELERARQGKRSPEFHKNTARLTALRNQLRSLAPENGMMDIAGDFYGYTLTKEYDPAQIVGRIHHHTLLALQRRGWVKVVPVPRPRDGKGRVMELKIKVLFND